MTLRQPFTKLCQQLARPRPGDRVDLHLHTTYSDGLYTPAEIIDLARRSGLAAVAITDHDTIAGVRAARKAAQGQVVVVSGVELTTRYEDQELHLLGYYVNLDHAALNAALDRLRGQRAERFQEMVERLRGCGVAVAAEDLPAPEDPAALGRRHLAEVLVKTRQADTVQQAFVRFLGDNGRVNIPKPGLPAAEAIALVRAAGGVAGWAHPPYDGTRERLGQLRQLGLQAVEVEHPTYKHSWSRQLRSWASELGLAVTGGSDCHGPTPLYRAVGARGITWQELEYLRQMANYRAV